MTATDVLTVRFARLERRGVMLGLAGGQLALLAIVLVVVLLAEFSSGIVGVITTSPIWGILLGTALLTVRGRPVVDWLPIVMDWRLRRLLRRTMHLTRPLTSPVSEDTLTLSGIRGSLSVVASPRTGAACIVDPRARTVTAILQVTGRGFILEDPRSQDSRVAGWARVLASLCQQPDIVRVQVVHRTSRGGASKVRQWWAAHALAGAPWASRVVAELVADVEESCDRQECLLSVAVRAPRGGKRPTADSLAAVDQHLQAICDSLIAADLHIHGWVTPGRLTRVLRLAYDPTGAARADTGEESSKGLSAFAGPMALSESWDSVRTDSAHHAVYWIEEWPRSDVHPGFLQPLILAPGARRSFTLVAEPLPAAKAFREIRRAKVEHTADAAQRARIGRLEDESVRAEAADLIRREQDLVAGHGDLQFVGLITVSAATRDELDTACAATESAAAQAMCELRRLVGQQGLAHAAASLPLARGLL